MERYTKCSLITKAKGDMMKAGELIRFLKRVDPEIETNINGFGSKTTREPYTHVTKRIMMLLEVDTGRMGIQHFKTFRVGPRDKTNKA